MGKVVLALLEPPGLTTYMARGLRSFTRHTITSPEELAADLGVSPEVLATRRDLEQLADGRQDVAVLKGWRRGVIGDRMLAAL